MSETRLAVGKRWRPGAVKSWERKGNSVFFNCEGGLLRLAVLCNNCLRVTFNPEHRVTDMPSVAVVNMPSCEAFTIEQNHNFIMLQTDELTVEVAKEDTRIKISDSQGHVVSEDADGLTWGRRSVRCTKVMDEETHFYGLGEKTGFLDKRGRKYMMWNTDDPVHTPTKDPLYKSIPLLLCFNGRWATGTFVDYTGRVWFDLGVEAHDCYSFEVENRELDYYFIYASELKRVIATYTNLTGRIYLPPLWALGYQQSRWGYYPEEVVRDLGDTFRRKGIPCDVIYLDIDYMDDYRIFTWDKEHFPDPERLIDDMRAKGFKIVTIVNPGIKKDPNYEVYVEGIRRNLFCRWLTGEVYHGRVWPGEAAFPDFTKEETRVWWAEKHRALLSKGVAGIWNDMNEPSDFSSSSENRTLATVPDDLMVENDGYPCTFGRIHNVYGLQMCRSTYEAFQRLRPGERPFILTRAAYAGIQRYAAVWTGDNCSWWEHLAMSLPLHMNIGLSGVPFVGGDVGGFKEDSTPELFARWIQVGAFTPFFRAHSMYNTRPHEPWAWGPKVEGICGKYIKLRYALLPYLYNEFYKASQTGLPIMRPLVLEYPQDERTHNLNGEFLCGESFLVAPVTQPGVVKQCVYLPEGVWFDYWTDRKYEGGNDYLVDAPLETLPLFVKAGAIIPSIPVVNYVGEKRPEVLTLDVYPHPQLEARYTFYEDDGLTQRYREGEFNLIDFSCHAAGEGFLFRIEPVVSGYRAGRKYYRLRFHGIPWAWEINGAQAPAGSGFRVDRGVIEIEVPDHGQAVNVSLGKSGARLESGDEMSAR